MMCCRVPQFFAPSRLCGQHKNAHFSFRVLKVDVNGLIPHITAHQMPSRNPTPSARTSDLHTCRIFKEFTSRPALASDYHLKGQGA